MFAFRVLRAMLSQCLKLESLLMSHLTASLASLKRQVNILLFVQSHLALVDTVLSALLENVDAILLTMLLLLVRRPIPS